MLFAARVPLDDLVRHILSRGWGYDYASHYGHHFVDQHWSYWIGFDWAVGLIHEASGDLLTTSRIVRALIFIAVGSAVVTAVRRAHSDPVVRAAAVAVILFVFLWFRLNLGRPEVLFTGLVVSALGTSRRAWLGLFLALSPAYWLAPIYLPGALLLGAGDETWRARLLRNSAVIFVGLLGWAAFWWWYSGGTLLHTAALLHQVLEIHGAAAAPVGEMLPLADGTRSPVPLALMGLLICGAWYAGGSRIPPSNRACALVCLGVAAVFCLPDYVRYGPTVWALLALSLLVMGSHLRAPPAAQSWALLGIALAVVLAMKPPADDATDAVLDALRVPPSSRVLTSFNASSYLAVAANPDSVITPIFDVSSTRPPFRELVVDLSLGRVDCKSLVRLGAFDYVVESTLNGQVPECLQLLRVDGRHRLWRVLEEDHQ